MVKSVTYFLNILNCQEIEITNLFCHIYTKNQSPNIGQFFFYFTMAVPE